MAITKKVIGRVPTYRGVYDDDKLYHMQNIVTYLGSAFISKIDNNRTVPCVVENNSFVLQDGWDFFADASLSYLLNESEIDIPESLFTYLKENNLLDTTKKYYVYEDEE